MFVTTIPPQRFLFLLVNPFEIIALIMLLIMLMKGCDDNDSKS